MTEQKFNTASEVLADPKCTEFIREVVNKITTDRANILDKARRARGSYDLSVRLKADAFSRLEEKRMFLTTRMISEFLTIEERKSDLPSAERSLISQIVGNAIYKTILFYAKQAEAEKALVPAPKTRKRKAGVTA